MNPVAVSRALDFAQEVLAAAREGEFVETFVQTATTTKVSFEANKLKDATVREARGLMVRMRDASGRPGSFATSDFSDPSATLAMARNLASLGDPADFEPQSTYAPAAVDTAPALLAGRSASDLVADGESLIAQLQAAIPAGLHALELFHTECSFDLGNSAGAQVRYGHTEEAGYLVTSVTRPEDQLEAYELYQSTAEGVDYANPLSRMVLKVQGCERPARLASGSYPVLFTPNALGTFHALTNALNGKPVVEGLSSLRDALGTQALSELLTIIDDPTVAGGPMSYPLDDEGVTASPTTLVDQGIVRGFLFDLRYGQRSGTGSTGNGIRCGRMSLGAGRSYQNEVIPHASNTIIGGGTQPLADLIRGLSRGVIVDGVMGVHTTNPISGDFALNLDLALVVEQGEIVGRLKDAMLSGNTFQLLRQQLLALSAERHWVGNTLAPWFLVDGLGISTAE